MSSGSYNLDLRNLTPARMIEIDNEMFQKSLDDVGKKLAKLPVDPSIDPIGIDASYVAKSIFIFQLSQKTRLDYARRVKEDFKAQMSAFVRPGYEINYIIDDEQIGMQLIGIGVVHMMQSAPASQQRIYRIMYETLQEEEVYKQMSDFAASFYRIILGKQ